MKDIKIKSLTWYEHIRKRPGMYIGTVENCDILTRELLDNSIDEALSGYCSDIFCDRVNGYITVADNGRGLPIYMIEDSMAPGTYITAMEAAVSRINTGSKYDKEEAAIGVHGVNLLPLINQITM